MKESKFFSRCGLCWSFSCVSIFSPRVTCRRHPVVHHEFARDRIQRRWELQLQGKECCRKHRSHNFPFCCWYHQYHHASAELQLSRDRPAQPKHDSHSSRGHSHLHSCHINCSAQKINNTTPTNQKIKTHSEKHRAENHPKTEEKYNENWWEGCRKRPRHWPLHPG